MAESSAEDLQVSDNNAPMKFQPRQTRNEGVAIYVHESLSYEIIEFDTGIDLNYFAICCTKLEEKKMYFVYKSPPRSMNNTSWSTSKIFLEVVVR